MTRKTFSCEFKAKVAIETIKAHKTVNEIAAEFEIHPTQVNHWKKQLLEDAAMIFNRRRQRQVKREAEFEKERELLYQQIGKLQVELEVLKKNLILVTESEGPPYVLKRRIRDSFVL